MLLRPDFPISKLHKDTYEAISPDRPELSQAGKTILIIGAGSDGVGGYIGNSFARAGASALVLAGRRDHVLKETAEKLKADHGAVNPNLKVHFHTVDIADPSSISDLWSWVVKTGIVVDVLILSAAWGSPIRSVLETDLEKTWEFFEVNTRSRLAFAEHFHKHDRRGSEGPKILLDLSASAAWNLIRTGAIPVYGMTKLCGTLAIQMIAKEVQADVMRCVSYHPASTNSAGSRAFHEQHNMPIKKDPDTPELSGNFALWLASPEAAFLHGRYVEAGWDVEELKSGKIREQIDSDPWFLKVGIFGLHPSVDMSRYVLNPEASVLTTSRA
ncbi:NAD(P)-binding protein, partial [Thozetella sp. PMI_491]